MPAKKSTDASTSDDSELHRLEKELEAIRREKALAAKENKPAVLAKLQEKETRLRTRLLEVKAASFATALSQPIPLEDQSKALLEVLEERLELIENRLTAIEDRLEKL